MISFSAITTLVDWPLNVDSRPGRLLLTWSKLSPFLAFALASSRGATTEIFVGGDGTSESLEISMISSNLWIGRTSDGEFGRMIKPDERGDVRRGVLLGDLVTGGWKDSESDDLVCFLEQVCEDCWDISG